MYSLWSFSFTCAWQSILPLSSYVRLWLVSSLNVTTVVTLLLDRTVKADTQTIDNQKPNQPKNNHGHGDGHSNRLTLTCQMEKPLTQRVVRPFRFFFELALFAPDPSQMSMCRLNHRIEPIRIAFRTVAAFQPRSKNLHRSTISFFVLKVNQI